MADSPEAAAIEAKRVARQDPNKIKIPTIDCDVLAVNDEHGNLLMES